MACFVLARGGDDGDRPDVRQQARLPARRHPGIPGDRRRQPRRRPRRADFRSAAACRSRSSTRAAGARTPLSGLVAALITLVVVAVLHRPAAQSAAAGAGGDRAGRGDGPRRGRRAAPHLALQPRPNSPSPMAAVLGVLGSGLLNGVLLGVGAVDRAADPPRRAAAGHRGRARPRHVVLRRSRPPSRERARPRRARRADAKGRCSTSTSITCATGLRNWSRRARPSRTSCSSSSTLSRSSTWRAAGSSWTSATSWSGRASRCASPKRATWSATP